MSHLDPTTGNYVFNAFNAGQQDVTPSNIQVGGVNRVNLNNTNPGKISFGGAALRCTGGTTPVLNISSLNTTSMFVDIDTQRLTLTPNIISQYGTTNLIGGNCFSQFPLTGGSAASDRVMFCWASYGDAPTVVGSNAGGTLSAGITYGFIVAYTYVQGGATVESMAGVGNFVNASGFTQYTVSVSALPSGATGMRVYFCSGGGNDVYTFCGSTSGTSVVVTGGVSNTSPSFGFYAIAKGVDLQTNAAQYRKSYLVGQLSPGLDGQTGQYILNQRDGTALTLAANTPPDGVLTASKVSGGTTGQFLAAVTGSNATWGTPSSSGPFGLNGKVVKYGLTNGTWPGGNGITVTFPTAFPTSCDTVLITGDNSMGIGYIWLINTRSTTAFTAVAYNATPITGNPWSVHWIAIGT